MSHPLCALCREPAKPGESVTLCFTNACYCWTCWEAHTEECEGCTVDELGRCIRCAGHGRVWISRDPTMLRTDPTDPDEIRFKLRQRRAHYVGGVEWED